MMFVVLCWSSYAWTITQCRRCSSHMGWRFTLAPGHNLKPEKFWGLCRASLKPGLQTRSETDDEALLLGTSQRKVHPQHHCWMRWNGRT